MCTFEIEHFEHLVDVSGFFEWFFRNFFFLFRSPDSSSGWSYTTKAFIFSLRNKEGLSPFKSMVTRPQYAIYRHSGYGPLFGSGNDIRIADNANRNTNSYTYFGYAYSAPSGVRDKKTILAGTYHFTPDEVEVFYLGWITLRSNPSTVLSRLTALLLIRSCSLVSLPHKLLQVIISLYY